VDFYARISSPVPASRSLATQNLASGVLARHDLLANPALVSWIFDYQQESKFVMRGQGC